MQYVPASNDEEDQFPIHNQPRSQKFPHLELSEEETAKAVKDAELTETEQEYVFSVSPRFKSSFQFH